MFQLPHIVHVHDPKLVAAAALVCALSSLTIFSVLNHIRAASNRSRGWVPLAALVAGAGIWSTHFIAMLAYETGTPVSYDPLLTLASFAAATILTGYGWKLSLHRTRVAPLAAGLVVTAGISIMHYTGMAAMTFAGSLRWNVPLIGLSLASCAALCIWAIKSHRRRDALIPWRPAAILVLAICSLHFIAMEAVGISLDYRRLPATTLLDPGSLAALVVAGSTLVVAAGFFIMLWDRVADREAAAAKIAHLAFHDVLTGLPNRSVLDCRLAEGIAEAGATNQPLAVVSIDLDGFKAVNDNHGHKIGDELLVQVANRLRALTRDHDLVARIGGDEFIIVQQGGSQPTAALDVAERVIAALSRPFKLFDLSVVIGASAGISIFPKDATDVDELIVKADIALYDAKSAGRGMTRLYDSSIGEGIEARRATERALAAAIRDRKLEVHFQPIANLDDGSIVALEALSRWDDPALGRIEPTSFIAIAEQKALIRDLGNFVLESACREAAGWRVPLFVAVNFSPVQFLQTDLAADVAAILTETGLDPRRLEIEVTENVLLANPEQTISIFSELKTLGVNIALDDFGTGYSSLGYFQRFAFDKVKIDRSFIANLDQPKAREIVRSIIDLGHNLEVVVVAEGVETEFQAAMLRTLRCEQAQGYLFGRPCPIEQLAHVTNGPTPLWRAAS